MSTLDWIIAIGALIAALEMKDMLRFQQFADEQRRRRPKPHIFG